ncbi:flagellar export chaperone FliS [Liquorilactobacillus mali]|uniref:Flagellar secretion chaperone FliS n=1 Tax=Liquorilactobacillus mali KCTC 3596 = DSM 20444 TaxID=1046596 RepID=J0L8M2_9LACO|nr:flagellar export chaperone FliS [Liquorilactobacillus mali]AJA34064.1 flagellar protein FliS [Liquorilactobacillus mali KCTC 3596 = DSM 20444]EJF02245.1 flagellin specific chaperone [Liquorilactobacillus mali KCTC 3596 = DSM 20444]KRN11088.1 flagellin-specific chaperone [Liquorilactobacillus mali KCTC 3596 = DSM 20444]MDC7953798.1 flagellar export chaperone FliS [Liquorilactobacillus mali]MDV7757504.1 flagellar export chaperone FliS [Liquorilactobacillus mali]
MYTDNRRAKDVYLGSQILGASPEKLVIFLYEGAIKSLKRAEFALDNSDNKSAHHELVKAQDIINELKQSINQEVAGELPTNLVSLYDFMLNELVKANLGKDKGTIGPVVDMLSELLESWQEVLAQQNNI